MKTLASRTLKGFGWSVTENLSGTGINFLVGIVLTRNLLPTDIGLYSFTLIFITFSTVLMDGGFSNALIRKTAPSPTDYNTAFVINVLIALGLYGVFFVTAPFVADFFRLPALTLAIRVVCLSVIIGSFAIIPKTYFTKHLQFKEQALVSLTASLIAGGVGIWMVYNNFSYWSLICLQLLRQSIITIGLWVVSTFKPRFQYDPVAAKSLFGYGSKILMSGLVDNLYNNLYTLVIGKVYSPHQLGLYSRADQFTSIFSVNLAMVLQRVSLPVLTDCKTDEEHLTNLYRNFIRYATLVSALLLFTFCAMADTLIEVLLGTRWMATVPILRILCLSALFQPLIMLNQNILQVFGKGKLFFQIEVGKKFFAVCVIAVALLHSMPLLLWGIVFISVVSYLLNTYFSTQHLPNYPMLRQFVDFIKCCLVVALYAIAVFLVGQYFSSTIWLKLLMQMVTVFIGLLLLFNTLFLSEWKQIKLMLLHSKKQQSQ